MPRRKILTVQEKDNLFLVPDNSQFIIQCYAFSENDRKLIKSYGRGAKNKLRIAILLCYLRYPGSVPAINDTPNPNILDYVAKQFKLPATEWAGYDDSAETRQDHLTFLRSAFGFNDLTRHSYKILVEYLIGIALQTDKGIVLAEAACNYMRDKKIIIPSIIGTERICAQALTLAERKLYGTLIGPLGEAQKLQLSNLLLLRTGSNISTLSWLRLSPTSSNSKQVLDHIERLKAIVIIGIPNDVEKSIHQNRLLKIAREGGQMTAQHLRDLEPNRRYATLVAILLNTKATIIDEIMDMHDHIIGSIFSKAKNTQTRQLQKTGKAINQKLVQYWKIGQTLLTAKENKQDPFKAIEKLMGWDAFVQSVSEAKELTKNEDFDYLQYATDNYLQLRRYAPAFLENLQFKAAPVASEILAGIETLKKMYQSNSKKIPPGAPKKFVSKRWGQLILADTTDGRRFYELCVLSELRNSLRSGDIWVAGSRRYKDFEDYLLPQKEFTILQNTNKVPLPVKTKFNGYLEERVGLLKQQLDEVCKLSKNKELTDIELSETGLKITPLTAILPPEAEAFAEKVYALLPHIKITELLTEVDGWCGFSKHFTHLKSGETVKDTSMLLTAILADGINMGLYKMAECCPGSSYARLSWLQAWHIRDENYSAALAEIVNAQYRHPFSAHWGDGTTSSSDGQRFRAANYAERMGRVNPKYGSEPGVQFYTHVSDQYAPFHAKLINVGVRDATYVLDGLLYHESDLGIGEHYTDTSGFTDHVFALMHLLGFRFAPRIKDLKDKKLYIPEGESYEALDALTGGEINVEVISQNWEDILRLATSIQQGVVTASIIVRKIGSYPRQNSLALALREIGRIERTLFTLDYLKSPELRRRIHAGLNKGESRNALARAVFFNRLGEVRDRSFETQSHRAGGLTLLTAAITRWNTVYIERAVNALKAHGHKVDEDLLQYLSPLGWAHINLTGDYSWETDKLKKGKFRPLRPLNVNQHQI